jgi:hypothetical protein
MSLARNIIYDWMKKTIIKSISEAYNAWGGRRMAGSIGLFAGATNALLVDGLTPNDDFTVETIKITVRTAGGAVLHNEIKIGQIRIPPALLDEHRKLLTWSAIQDKIKKERDKANQAALKLAAEWETARDELRAALSNVVVDVNAGAGFLGVGALPLQAGGTIDARANIDLITLGSGPDDAVFLTAAVAGQGQLMFPHGQAQAALAFEVTLTRGELAYVLPSISIKLPNFPPLHLHWPKIRWPDLQWPSIDLSALANLLRFDLPLPKLGTIDLPMRIDWTRPGPAPQFHLAIGGKKLSIRSDAANGTLVCETLETRSHSRPVICGLSKSGSTTREPRFLTGAFLFWLP